MPAKHTRPCATPGCVRFSRSHGLCPACRKRWRYANEPGCKEKELAKVKAWQATETGKTLARAASTRAKAKRQGWGDGLYGRCIYAQSLRCAICRRPFEIGDQQNKDHCHATGKARGVLCRACNISLGYYEKHQHPVGLRIACYDEYLADPPVARLETST